MNDPELIDALLALPVLSPKNRAAFASMRRLLEKAPALSQAQREWAQDVAARAGLQVGSPGYTAPKDRKSAWDPKKRRPRPRRRPA